GGTVGSAGDALQAAFGLHHGVVPRLAFSRSGVTVTRDGAVHESGVARRERRVIKAELAERAWPEVFHHHVALGDQPVENRSPFRLLEVERDAFLVAIDAQEVRALALEERRAPRARIVALARLLNLDHARAHVAEH